MKNVILLMGLPRSGKSTLAKQLHKELGYPIVNPDDCRRALHGEAYIQRAERQVWTLVFYMANALLLGHEGIIVDACNRTRKRRDEWRYELHLGNWEIQVAEVVTPKEICIARAEGDDRLIGIIERMAAGYELLGQDEKLYDRFRF
jgi:predicted kinase